MYDLIRSSPDEARRRVDRIRGHVASAWEEVIAAYKHRDHEVLGYGTGTTGWDAYILGEFGESRLSLPKHQRVSHVIEANSEGMSNRAIASAAGVTEGTVRNDLHPEVRKNYAPAPAPRISDETSAPSVPSPAPAPSITGMDRKEYSRPEPKPQAAQRPPRPSRRPITDVLHGISVNIDRELTRFFDSADDRASTVTNDVETMTRNWRNIIRQIEDAYSVTKNETPAETGEGSQ